MIRMPKASLLAGLDANAVEELFADLNYMNLGELRSFCSAHRIPRAICVETASGELRRTRDTDRKSVVLERIRTYLRTGVIPPPTCFAAHVVADGVPPSRLKPADRLYYGWYDKTNPAMVDLLRGLTNGKFRNGAIARILAREFWTAGRAPTFTEFARSWLHASEKGLGVAAGRHPEAAWLTDRANQEAGPDWKAKRVRRAKRALKVLSALPQPTERGG